MVVGELSVVFPSTPFFRLFHTRQDDQRLVVPRACGGAQPLFRLRVIFLAADAFEEAQPQLTLRRVIALICRLSKPMDGLLRIFLAPDSVEQTVA